MDPSIKGIGENRLDLIVASFFLWM